MHRARLIADGIAAAGVVGAARVLSGRMPTGRPPADNGVTQPISRCSFDTSRTDLGGHGVDPGPGARSPLAWSFALVVNYANWPPAFFPFPAGATSVADVLDVGDETAMRPMGRAAALGWTVMSTSRFAVWTPRVDFFWNACKT